MHELNDPDAVSESAAVRAVRARRAVARRMSGHAGLLPDGWLSSPFDFPGLVPAGAAHEPENPDVFPA